jgi:hypothetical protein
MSYIDTPKLEEVLVEQFAYLMEHVQTCKVECCRDCRRSAKVVALLVEPFELAKAA